MNKEKNIKEREIDFARLTAQSDKMSIKSACDVRIEVLTREREQFICQMESYKNDI